MGPASERSEPPLRAVTAARQHLEQPSPLGLPPSAPPSRGEQRTTGNRPQMSRRADHIANCTRPWGRPFPPLTPANQHKNRTTEAGGVGGLEKRLLGPAPCFWLSFGPLGIVGTPQEDRPQEAHRPSIESGWSKCEAQRLQHSRRSTTGSGLFKLLSVPHRVPCWTSPRPVPPLLAKPVRGCFKD